jgi:hypothetical protein
MPQNFGIDKLPIVKNQYQSALKQIGTLGVGNAVKKARASGFRRNRPAPLTRIP